MDDPSPRPEPVRSRSQPRSRPGRRNIRLLLLAITLIGCVAIWFGLAGRPAELTLVFCGYTNLPGSTMKGLQPFSEFRRSSLETNGEAPSPAQNVFIWHGTTAVFRVTNTGGTRIWRNKWAVYEGEDFLFPGRTNALVPGTNVRLKPGRFLRPGETELLTVEEPYEGGEHWRVALSYYPGGPPSKLRKICGESRWLVYLLHLFPPLPREEMVRSNMIERDNPNPHPRAFRALQESGDLVTTTFSVSNVRLRAPEIQARLQKERRAGIFCNVRFDYRTDQAELVCFKDDLPGLRKHFEDQEK